MMRTILRNLGLGIEFMTLVLSIPVIALFELAALLQNFKNNKRENVEQLNGNL